MGNPSRNSPPKNGGEPPGFTLRITTGGVTKLHSRYAGTVFRRRTQTTTDDTPVHVEDPKPSATPSKGRPTPKRSEAQGRRRSPVTAPQNRKEAYAQAKERDRLSREKNRQAMLRGDEAALPARDKGPVRKYARDFIDSRRLPGQYLLPFIAVLLVLSWIPFPLEARRYVMLVFTMALPVVMILVILSSFYIGGRVRKEAAAKFPNESTKGVAFYAAMRGSQMRFLRFPKPTVLPGGKPVPPKK